MSVPLQPWLKPLYYLEKAGPLVFSVIATILWKFGVGNSSRDAMALELAGPLLSVIAIAIGFIAASLSIVLTAGTRAIVRFRSSNAYPDMVKYHTEANIAGVLSCLSSLIILANKHYDGPRVPDFMDSAWLFTLVWAGLCFSRILLTFNRLMPKDKETP